MIRSVRLSQTIAPFGVGTIYDVGGESLIGTDITTWPYDQTRRVNAPRLERSLGVAELRSPPSVASRPAEASPGIWYHRFPEWVFCQNCRRIERRTENRENGDRARCPHCNGLQVPMRFVAVCRRSHIMDVPWDRWAHAQAETDDQRRCRKPQLKFLTRSNGSEGLSGLEVRCITCDSAHNLGGIMSTAALQRIGVHCTGNQPWQLRPTDCPERLEVLQRGATTVTLPETVSGIDIPEPTTPSRDIDTEIRNHANYRHLRSAPTGPRSETLIEIIAEDLGITPDQVRRHLQQGDAPVDELEQARIALLHDEWRAFTQAVDAPGREVGTATFVVTSSSIHTDPPTPVERLLTDHIAVVVLGRRLREVRALTGFRRYGYEAALIPVDLTGRSRWWPAVETFGEGIFLALDQEKLKNWENDEPVLLRADRLERRRQSSTLGSRQRPVTPRSLLLHTLAHILIRRLAFTSGYPSASLRERVYAADPEAGLLIYTADGDIEGTLGGLVRQGEPPHLARTVLGALETAAWCSADPVCRESAGQGLHALNLAACHACSLISETSCERSNVLLDRVMLVGDDATPGYFTDVIERARQLTSARPDVRG